MAEIRNEDRNFYAEELARDILQYLAAENRWNDAVYRHSVSPGIAEDYLSKRQILIAEANKALVPDRARRNASKSGDSSS